LTIFFSGEQQWKLHSFVGCCSLRKTKADIVTDMLVYCHTKIIKEHFSLQTLSKA